MSSAVSIATSDKKKLQIREDFYKRTRCSILCF